MNIVKQWILHIKVWNKWRKHNLNGLFYQLLVLFGVVKSTTFFMGYLELGIDEVIKRRERDERSKEM